MIRKAGPADREGIRQLLAEVWQGDELSVAYHLRSPALSTLMAEEQDQLVGYAQLSRSSLHPTYGYTGVHVAPVWRGRGIGGALWAELTRQASGPLKTALYSEDESTQRFLERRGLHLSLETHLDTLDLSSASSELPGVPGVQLTSFAAFQTDPRICLAVSRLHHQLYQQAHRHDPAQPISDSEAQATYLGSDLRPDWLWLAWQGEQLVGLSSVRTGESPTQAELGWFGTLGLEPELSRQVVRALTLRALQAARAGGVLNVLGEFDSLDPLALWLRQMLAFQAGRLWLTFTGLM